jgi:hypothetical protein
VRASGLHFVHLIIKLPTALAAERARLRRQSAAGSPGRFTVSDPEKRWMKAGYRPGVTLGPREPEPVDRAKPTKIDARMARYSVWVDVNDRSDQGRRVGFADLMPGSGHGYGGFISMARIEVYGKKGLDHDGVTRLLPGRTVRRHEFDANDAARSASRARPSDRERSASRRYSDVGADGLLGNPKALADLFVPHALGQHLEHFDFPCASERPGVVLSQHGSTCGGIAFLPA